jgi:hypothetical protein
MVSRVHYKEYFKKKIIKIPSVELELQAFSCWKSNGTIRAQFTHIRSKLQIFIQKFLHIQSTFVSINKRKLSTFIVRWFLFLLTIPNEIYQTNGSQ